MKLPIYMDNHSTTPVDPRVLARMLPFFSEDFGNAASRSHAFGWKAEAAVEAAREEIAKLIGATGREIVLTSGATESDNLALTGVTDFLASKGNHVITQQTEHKAVLDTCKALEKRGVAVTYLGVDKYGRVDPQAVADAITLRTVLVSVMLANNEVGTLQPIREIGALCRARGVLFHTDAAQGVGKIPFDVEAHNVDLASLSAHKMYGPKGVGALYVRRKNPRVRLTPIIHGGGHERGMRSGTLNVPAIVGFGEAAKIAGAEMPAESSRIQALRDKLARLITAELDQVQQNGHPVERLPGNLNLSFAYVEGEALMMAMRDVAVSSGSACTSASLEPSYVLRAMGVPDELTHASIRFGLGRFNVDEEVDHVARLVVAGVKKLRAMSPLYEMAQEGIDPASVAWGAP
ncbi:MAG: IscS subfamily cysteine desulfurase [Deltaproteobacteria bacterium]|nr:IscS subfamily cysteine desulfurase [Deltaproteobacteria bacterium]